VADLQRDSKSLQFAHETLRTWLCVTLTELQIVFDSGLKFTESAPLRFRTSIISLHYPSHANSRGLDYSLQSPLTCEVYTLDRRTRFLEGSAPGRYWINLSTTTWILPLRRPPRKSTLLHSVYWRFATFVTSTATVQHALPTCYRFAIYR